MNVVATASCAEEALPLLRKKSPDILLVDLNLSGMSGTELIKAVSGQPNPPLILAHTMHDDVAHVFPAIRAGALGYIVKGAAPRELIEAIVQLSEGGSPMSPQVARMLMQSFQADAKQQSLYDLSPREREVLRTVAKGKTYKEIAAEFSISVNTVHAHIKNCYEKLQANSRGEALESARRLGILAGIEPV